MIRLVAALSMIALTVACVGPQAQRQQAQLTRGHEIAATNCARCHAVERTGDSTLPEAPPFRTLSRHYRVDSLQEALAEGISVGHPAMPQFQFAPDDVDALIAYLQDIQDDHRRAGAPSAESDR